MIQSVMKIVANEKLGPDLAQLTLADFSGLSAIVQAGQFVNVRVSNAMDPLFRRPFSVFNVLQGPDGGWRMQILFKVRGRGTRILRDLEPGQELDLIGPCGSGFHPVPDRERHVLIGGGIGAAALHLMARRLVESKRGSTSLHIFLGADTAGSLVYLDAFAALGTHLRIATDDGTKGYRGPVTELFAKALTDGSLSSDMAVYACGPEPMLRALAPLCERHAIPTQISVERRMACGMGICLSCVCKIRKDKVQQFRDMHASAIQCEESGNAGYALTCLDGPVFRLEEVVLDE